MEGTWYLHHLPACKHLQQDAQAWPPAVKGQPKEQLAGAMHNQLAPAWLAACCNGKQVVAHPSQGAAVDWLAGCLGCVLAARGAKGGQAAGAAQPNGMLQRLRSRGRGSHPTCIQMQTCDIRESAPSAHIQGYDLRIQRKYSVRKSTMSSEHMLCLAEDACSWSSCGADLTMQVRWVEGLQLTSTGEQIMDICLASLQSIHAVWQDTCQN